MTSREIDALVAEHCMGEKRLSPEMIRRGYRENFSFYSSDPNASKQLRDKMRADGWLSSMEDRRLESGPLSVKARFRKFGAPESYAATSDTEEMAVALAALAAVGHPVEATA